MAATINKVPNGEDVWGKQRTQIVDIVGDTSYPTGGYVISPARLGMKTILGAHRIGGNAVGGKRHVSWDNVNGKLLFLDGATGVDTDVANATDVSASTARMLFIGN